MENFEEILIEKGWSKREKKASIDFKDIEKSIGFKLPTDYKSYVENFYGNENFIGNEYVKLWDAENELLENNEGYRITENLKNTFGIGGNGSGEFIAIEYFKNDNYRIVLSPFIDLSKESFIEIGISFSDFLNRLKNGKNWFE
ncbi:SMI1/KNR4 family protein [Flavobacterium sp. GNP001]